MAPAVAPKRQRKMLTIAQKVGLLDMLKEGKSYAAVGRHYGINESSVRYKKKEENNIRTTAAISFNKDAKRVVTVRNKTIVRMESEQDDADPRPLTSTFHAEPSPFNASKGWSEKFQKPFGLKSVSLQGEATSADTAGAEAYVNNKFKVIIEEGGYKPEQVFNMDVTGLFWKRMPSRTFIMQDEAKAPGFKAQKDRVTLVMCGNANALPVYWMHNAKAWMTKALNLDWFKQCFIPQVKRYLRGKGLDFKVLLLVDNAGGHADDLSYDGVQIEFLPPNTTSLIQPMDQGIIRAFKALYTRNTLQHLVAAMDSYQDFSLQAYWREDTIASCLQNIQRAIQEMKTETLNACWKKLWPKAVHNPTGCSLDEIHHSAVDAAVNLARQLGGDGQQAANLPVLFAARSATLGRGRQIGGLSWSTDFPPRRVHLFSPLNLRRQCAGPCVRWAVVSMTCTVVRPTAGEFENQETADHSRQSITSSVDIKMSNWTATEIQEMLASPLSL
uniref:DDE-1 domain-containing protein n=1 Tax=Sparus aurata TaxID=8175 RepID=A0A671XX33_SPAAU